MPGIVSGFLAFFSDLGFFSFPFLLPFLITSPKLSYFVGGPRVMLGFGGERMFEPEGYGLRVCESVFHPHAAPSLSMAVRPCPGRTQSAS